MIRDLGWVEPGTTLYIPFHTFDSNDPSASVTLSGLAVTDVEIYKDGGTTQRGSDNGYTLLDTDGIDFDGITGIHALSISLADNTTAGFYSAGSQYWVVISSVTVDAATINFILCTFRIGYQGAQLNTTIASLSSQTSFTLTSGPAEDDALNGCIVLIHDVASAVQKGFAVVQDYTGSTKTVTLLAGTTFTAAATDNISFFAPVNANYAGAVAYSATRGLAGTALPAVASGSAGALITSGTGTAQLSVTSGVASANVTQLGGDAQSATDLKDFADAGYDPATNKVEGVKLADTLTTYTGNTVQTGDSYAIVNSGTFGNAAIKTQTAAIETDTAEIGAAGAGLTNINLPNQTMDIVGNITGNLSGSVGTVTGAVGSVTAGVTLAASAVQAIWDALTSALTTAGSIGKLLVDNVNATISSRSSHTAANVRTEMDSNSTQLAAIVADTDELQTDWADGGRLDLILDARASQSSLSSLITTVGVAGAGLTAADDAVITAIAALNNISAAQVNAEVDTALADVGLTTTITGRIDAAVSSRATPAQVNTEVLDVLNVDTLIDGKTIVQAVQYVSAICAGRVSGAGTGTEVFKGLDESTTRVTVTVDGSGNRSDIVYG